jgi:hypothetical protein
LDLCQVETITRVDSTDEATDELPKYEFLLTDGSKVNASLDVAKEVIFNLGDAWATIAREKIAKIQIHLENLRPPKEHLTTVGCMEYSRKGGAPYAAITLKNGKTVVLDAARWLSLSDGSLFSKLEKASFLPEGQEKSQDLDVTKLVSVHWRGARADEVLLSDGKKLSGRIDIGAMPAAWRRWRRPFHACPRRWDRRGSA